MTGAPLRVVVDCDPGIDDALALLALAHHHRTGRVRLCAVVAVAGNVPLGRTALNARFVLDQAGLEEVPVVAGADRPISGGGQRDPGAVHGEDGLGGLGPSAAAPLAGRPGAEPLQPSPQAGVVAREPAGGRPVEPASGRAPLAPLLERFGQPDPVHLLATGPLTDLALAVRAAPHLPERVDRLVAMGGALGSPDGNATARTEFNFWADPTAAAAVCRASFRLELVPLDVTEQVALGIDALRFLEARLGSSSLVCRMARAGIDFHRRRAGVARLALHDPLAAAVLVAPDLVGEVEGGLSVCVTGAARGQVQVVDEPPVQRVALSVDAARAEAAILDALAGT